MIESIDTKMRSKCDANIDLTIKCCSFAELFHSACHVLRMHAQFRLFYFRSSSIYSAAGRLVMSRNVIHRYLIERIDPLGGMDVSCELHYVEQSVSFRFPSRIREIPGW